MASRYFVGTGFWFDSSRWSNTSGGATGFSIPVSTDNVFFDGNSVSCTINPQTSVSCNNLDCTGFSGTIYLGQETGEGLSASNLTVLGNCVLSGSMFVKSYSIDEVDRSAGAGILRIEGQLDADGTTLGGILGSEDLQINLKGSLGTVQNLTATNVNANSGKTIYAPSSTLVGCHNIVTDSGPTSTIHITNFSELQDISSDLTAEYILDNDIDCTGEIDFVPIGTSGSPFIGSFDGQGFTIKNININSSIYSNTIADVGIFGVVNGIFVRNLNIENVTIKGGFRVGALIGTLSLGDVINCRVDGLDLTHSSRSGIGTSTVGGLIGRVNVVSTLLGIYITDCFSSGNITIDVSAVGGGGGLLGLVNGKNTSDYYVNISDCVTSVNISVPTPTFGRNSSGFSESLTVRTKIDRCIASGTLSGQQCSGFSQDVFEDVIIRTCISTCDISSTGSCAGFICNSCFTNVSINKCYYSGDITQSSISNGTAGFINEIDDSDVIIKNCYSRGTISASLETGVGGFLGGSIFGGTIRNCYTEMTVQGDSDVGGFIGLFDSGLSLTIENCFSVGIVTGNTDFGGFIGRTAGSGVVNLINCAWFTGSSNNAIGNFGGSPVSLLATGGYGTDEPDNTTFQNTTDHVVFAQGT